MAEVEVALLTLLLAIIKKSPAFLAALFSENFVFLLDLSFFATIMANRAIIRAIIMTSLAIPCLAGSAGTTTKNNLRSVSPFLAAKAACVRPLAVKIFVFLALENETPLQIRNESLDFKDDLLFVSIAVLHLVALLQNELENLRK